MQHVFYNAKGKEEWRCHFCLSNYQLRGRTHTIRTHLELYSIIEDSPMDIKAKNIQIDIQKAMDSAAKHP
jgi:hypothetical protein